jgi:alkylation response protein AidB-like acyl-CoA dehydrogenase
VAGGRERSVEHVRTWWLQRDLAHGSAIHTDQPAVAEDWLRALVAEDPPLPLPGHGQTTRRFAVLSAFGEIDLTVARLAEAHYDAIATLTELADDTQDCGMSAGEVWAVWAAEPPHPRLTARRGIDGSWRLAGRKAWCSGAGMVDRALVTADTPDGSRLFAVVMREPEIRPVDDPWPVPTLAGTDTRSVDFTDAPAVAVGSPGGYVARPSFWYGAVGVAAVWCGGAHGVAARLLAASRSRELGEIDRAHLGAIATALAGARGALLEAAMSFDSDNVRKPEAAEITARAARAVVEDAVSVVIDRVGRALGPAPLALDREHARRVADLQLYVRQSHADRDLAELGRRIVETGDLS